MMARRLSRRTVLLGGIAAATGVVVGVGCSSSGGDGDVAGEDSPTGDQGEPETLEAAALDAEVSPSIGPNLRGLFAAPRAVAALGVSVVTTLGASSVEESVTALEELGVERGEDGILDIDDPVAFADAMRSAAAAEAAADRMVTIEGWPLSRVEASLALLLAAG